VAEEATLLTDEDPGAEKAEEIPEKEATDSKDQDRDLAAVVEEKIEVVRDIVPDPEIEDTIIDPDPGLLPEEDKIWFHKQFMHASLISIIQ